jgi:hypothetical protein
MEGTIQSTFADIGVQDMRKQTLKKQLTPSKQQPSYVFTATGDDFNVLCFMDALRTEEISYIFFPSHGKNPNAWDVCVEVVNDLHQLATIIDVVTEHQGLKEWRLEPKEE